MVNKQLGEFILMETITREHGFERHETDHFATFMTRHYPEQRFVSVQFC